MLQHKESGYDPLSPTPALSTAAQTRVTPQELANAIAALQARKEEAARRLDGTIPLGDAVQQLHLDATPEELLAEVEAQRRIRSAVSPNEIRRTNWILGSTFAGALLFLTTCAVLTSRHHPQQEQGAASTDAEPGLMTHRVSAPDQNVRIIAGTRRLPVIRLLSEISDNQPVNCDLPTFNTLLYSVRHDDSLSVNVPITRTFWTLIKHNRQVYMCGWLPYPMSRKALGSDHIGIYNVPNAPALKDAHPTPIELRLDRFTGKLIDGRYNEKKLTWSEIDVSAVQPDEHVGEGW